VQGGPNLASNAGMRGEEFRLVKRRGHLRKRGKRRRRGGSDLTLAEPLGER